MKSPFSSSVGRTPVRLKLRLRAAATTAQSLFCTAHAVYLPLKQSLWTPSETRADVYWAFHVLSGSWVLSHLTLLITFCTCGNWGSEKIRHVRCRWSGNTLSLGQLKPEAWAQLYSSLYAWHFPSCAADGRNSTNAGVTPLSEGLSGPGRTLVLKMDTLTFSKRKETFNQLPAQRYLL